MKEVKIGCFGFNGHQIHANIPQLTRARLTAVSGVMQKEYEDLKKSSPEAFAEAVWYPNLESLLAESGVDLVSFCSPRRADQAKEAVQALKAGKHVLAEKPMATTADDLDLLEAAAAEAGRRLWTMLPVVYWPQIKGMKAVIDSGEIGTIVQVYSMASYPYHERRPQDPDVDGGIIMQAGIHAVSAIGHITGLDFEEVYAQDTGTGNPRAGDLRMAANITCRMSNGALVSILCNYCNPRAIGYYGNLQIRIHGAEGMIEMVDGLTRRMLVFHDKGPTEFSDGESQPSYPQDIIDAILDDRPALLKEDAGIEYTRVVIRAQESATRGVAMRV